MPYGTARRLAGWHELTGDEEAAAVAELRELAAGRADLLAEVAGRAEGFSEGALDEPLARNAARLCRLADADFIEQAVADQVAAVQLGVVIPVGVFRGRPARRPQFSQGGTQLVHVRRGSDLVYPRW